MSLIRTPHDTLVLIGTGPDVSILRALGAALQPWERTIDLLILTNSAKSSSISAHYVSSRYRVLRRMTLFGGHRLLFDEDFFVNITIK